MPLFGKKDAQQPKIPIPQFPGAGVLPSRKTEPGKRELEAGLPVWSGVGGRPEDLGVAPARTGVLTRLQTLRPNELAFLIAGLGILVLAPVAEYLLVGSEQTSSLKPAFSDKSAQTTFEESPSPFEEGINGIAQGGLLGGNKELITPNSSSDPLSLIMKGERASQDAAPAAVSSIPPAETKKDDSSSSGWKDVLNSAKSAVKAAASKAPGLPRPSEKLSSQMRGLASLTGSGGGAGGGSGTAASVSASSPQLAPLSSKGLVSAPKGVSGISPIQSAAGFKGLASGTGGGAPGRGVTDVAGAAGFLQDLNVNRVFAGSAGSGGAGGHFAGGSRFSSGDATAFPSGAATLKDQTTLTRNKTEDLNELRKKLEMQKAIDLKWDKKNYEELGRKKMMEQIMVQTLAQTAQQAFLKVLDKLLNPQGQGQQAQQ